MIDRLTSKQLISRLISGTYLRLGTAALICSDSLLHVSCNMAVPQFSRPNMRAQRSEMSLGSVAKGSIIPTRICQFVPFNHFICIQHLAARLLKCCESWKATRILFFVLHVWRSFRQKKYELFWSLTPFYMCGLSTDGFLKVSFSCASYNSDAFVQLWFSTFSAAEAFAASKRRERNYRVEES